MTFLTHIGNRILNRPLLITEQKASEIVAVLGDRIGIDGGNVDASRFLGELRQSTERIPYRVQNGVAIVTVNGSLVARGAWIGSSSGLVSYEGIAAQLRASAADPDVHAIVLDLATPGGEVGGTFETASLIRSIGKTKRVVAVASPLAASAGYLLASAANEVVVEPSAEIGSIGVVLLHVDRSAEMKKRGWSPTLIFAGRHKVDGNPFGPLPDDVRSRLQAEVGRFYLMFLEAVGSFRPMLGIAGAKATEAKTFSAREAVTAKLADRVGTLDEVVSTLSTHRRNTGTMFGHSTSTATTAQGDETFARLAALRAKGTTRTREERYEYGKLITLRSRGKLKGDDPSVPDAFKAGRAAALRSMGR